MLTHLGVRVPLLLFPSLRASSDTDPDEQICSQRRLLWQYVTLYQYQQGYYNLLDKRIYADDHDEPLSPAVQSVNGDNNVPLVVTFGEC